MSLEHAIEVENKGARESTASFRPPLPDRKPFFSLPYELFVKVREITIERAQIAALNEHVVAGAEHNRAKAVPLRLEKEITFRRKLGRELRQHRLDWRRDGKGRARGHDPILACL